MAKFQTRTGLRIGELLASRGQDYIKTKDKVGNISTRINVKGSIEHQTK